MNIKTTLVLLVILAGVGIYFGLFQLGRLPKPQPREPDIVLFGGLSGFNTDDLTGLTVTYQGKSETFVRAPDKSWHFGTPDGAPVFMEKFSGIIVNLQGPHSPRELPRPPTPTPVDLVNFGLAAPQTVLEIQTSKFLPLRVEIGNKTPDGNRNYLRFPDSPGTEPDRIFLVDSSWGDLFPPLVTQPPYFPTPTPAVTDTPTPRATGTP